MFDRHDVARFVKQIIFGQKGEPYTFQNTILRFLSGSRPIKLKYINSKSPVTRNEVLQIKYFSENFKPSDVLWDIGSHHGHYSIFGSSIVEGKNNIFSFEPDTAALSTQKKNIELNKFQDKIKVFNLAVSDKEGELKFKMLNGNSQSHIAKSTEVNEDNIVTVPTKTLNSLLNEIPKPTFVKIDTEGAEIDIISQGSKLLEDKSIRFVCELHPFAWKSFNVEYRQFEETLKKYNRTLLLLDPEKKLSDLPYYGTVMF